jgi:S1-C subfamily serine protease
VSLVLLWVDAHGRPRARALTGKIRVGRSPDADVVLDDPSVSVLHATIDAGEVPPVLTASGAVHVNEMPVRSLRLREGDTVRFGNVEATVSDATKEAAFLPPATAPRPVRRPSPPPGGPAPDPAPAGFPFVRVAVVALVIFGGAFAINSARNVRWKARLEEDPRRADRLTPTPAPTEIATVKQIAPTPSPRPQPAAPPAPTSVASAGESPLNAALRSVVSIGTHQHVGTGFFVTDSGMILTNAHVMEERGAYWARTYDGRRLSLSDRDRSRELDLGLFAAIGEGPFPVLAFGSAKSMNYGDQVWAIGSPLAEEFSFSVTRGIVSSPLRMFRGHSYLQHDAAINPGNSGGPLLDRDGRLIGVNTWKVAGNTQGLGFAIPVEVVEAMLKSWKVGAAPSTPAVPGGGPEKGGPGPSRGRLSVSEVTTTDRVSLDGVRAVPSSGGLLVAGEVVNVGRDFEQGFIEISATRRDGTVVRKLVTLPGLDGGRRTGFSAELAAPPGEDPRSLRAVTAAAKIHLLPHTNRSSPGYRDYLGYADCLAYWGRPAVDPKTLEADQVEVHAVNSCPQTVPAAATWFLVRLRALPGGLEWKLDDTAWRFLDDVPAHGELTQFVQLAVKKDAPVRVRAWRPD